MVGNGTSEAAPAVSAPGLTSAHAHGRAGAPRTGQARAIASVAAPPPQTARADSLISVTWLTSRWFLLLHSRRLHRNVDPPHVDRTTVARPVHQQPRSRLE